MKGEKRLGEVMRFGQTALLAGLSLVLMQPALAGGWNEQCDWFENAAIGTRCAQSWSFSTGLSYDWYGYKSSGLSGVNSVDEQYYPKLRACSHAQQLADTLVYLGIRLRQS